MKLKFNQLDNNIYEIKTIVEVKFDDLVVFLY
jgi:hypothetical protein